MTPEVVPARTCQARGEHMARGRMRTFWKHCCEKAVEMLSSSQCANSAQLDLSKRWRANGSIGCFGVCRRSGHSFIPEQRTKRRLVRKECLRLFIIIIFLLRTRPNQLASSMIQFWRDIFCLVSNRIELACFCSAIFPDTTKFKASTAVLSTLDKRRPGLFARQISLMIDKRAYLDLGRLP